MELNTYLTFDGQCKEAMNFYADCLHGKIHAMLTFGETPMGEQTPPEWRDKIMHSLIMIGDEALMGADAPPSMREQPQGFSVTVNVDTAAEAERIFNALAEGGTVNMALQETFWALRFGTLSDRFGTPWMINCPRPQ